MVRRWWVFAAISFVSAVVAETLNILVPDRLFIQWVLFILSIVCFIIAITAWDRHSGPAAARREVPPL